MTPHIVIAGGGTGGHLFPGLAVAEELRRRGAQVSFVGTKRGIEARLVPQHGYPLHFLEISGLKRQGFLGTLRSLFRLPKALRQAQKLLDELRPDAILGVGGYASGPLVYLASRCKLPTAILEQNSVPGLTNRILGRFVDRIFTFFPQAAQSLPASKIDEIGNPIRSSLRPKDWVPNESSRPLRLLVLGGSQGAHAINQLLPNAIAQLASSNRASVPLIVHQTGSPDEGLVRDAYRAASLSEPEVVVHAFIEDMAAAYAHCDLVLGRAGATTLAEITAMGLPSLLIPFPAAADDHQTHNARFLEQAGAARLLIQSETTPEILANYLGHLSTHRGELAAMAQASKSLGRPEAAKQVAEWLLEGSHK